MDRGSDVKEKIIDFINTELLNGRSSVTPADDLLLSGMIDSLGVMRLVTFIEEDSGLKIPAVDITIEHFQNVNAIMAYTDGLKAKT